MMYVYYDEKHTGSVIGKDKAMEFIELSNADIDRKVCVSVKEGSLLPKDEFSEASNAVMLAGINKIDDISLFDKLGFSNPQESAERLYMQNTAPQLLYPEAAKAAVMANQAMQIEQAATDMTINEQATAGQIAVKGEGEEEKK